jgi:hypothetical protein
VKSTAFSQNLSKNNSLVFSKSQAAKDAFLFLYGKDSTHLYFPDYTNHIRNLPNEHNTTHLEVWDVQYTRESNNAADTSQFMSFMSEMKFIPTIIQTHKYNRLVSMTDLPGMHFRTIPFQQLFLPTALGFLLP